MIDLRTLLFVLSDGGRARLVRRAPDSDGYVTIEEMDNATVLRALKADRAANPATRVFDSVGKGRHGADEDESDRMAKEAFVAEVADRAAVVTRRDGLAAVFLAAPAGLVAPLQDRLAAAAPVCGTLGKDLTKVPDRDLGAWLDDAHFAPSRPG
ncbi:MAG: host attachment protein [Brevundimonas sp.]